MLKIRNGVQVADKIQANCPCIIGGSWASKLARCEHNKYNLLGAPDEVNSAMSANPLAAGVCLCTTSRAQNVASYLNQPRWRMHILAGISRGVFPADCKQAIGLFGAQSLKFLCTTRNATLVAMSASLKCAGFVVVEPAAKTGTALQPEMDAFKKMSVLHGLETTGRAGACFKGANLRQY